MNLHIALIVAMTADRVIGVEGQLPWKLSADLKHFKQTTMGLPVIMGRRTWESIGQPLKGRTNIVLTTQDDYEVIGGHVAGDVREALELARQACIQQLAASFENPAEAVRELRVMVIGGESIYKTFLPVAERIYMTLVHADVKGDTFFPEFDAAEWVETSREERQADERNVHDYSFVVLDRKVALGGTSGGGIGGNTSADSLRDEGASDHEAPQEPPRGRPS
jgi:dihydrofolate reductase